jgi:hypothetical protein
MQHAEYQSEVIQGQIRLMQERGIFTPPGRAEQTGTRAKKVARRMVKKKGKSA